MKTLPDFVYSKKERIINIIILTILFVTIIVITALEINDFLYLGIFILVFVSSVIAILKNNILLKASKEVTKNLNFKKFSLIMNDLLSKNISDETRNYVNIIYANYLAVKDLDESFNVFETTRIPKNKKYHLNYKLTQLCYLYNKREYDKALLLIERLEEKTSYGKLVEKIKLRIELKDTNKVKENIEKIFLVNTRNKLDNISNMAFLQEYYFVREDIEKAKKYAKMILDYNSDFDTYVDRAKKLLEDY